MRRRPTGSSNRVKDPVGGCIGIAGAVHDMPGELVHTLPMAQVTYSGAQRLYGDRLDLVAGSTHAAIP